MHRTRKSSNRTLRIAVDSLMAAALTTQMCYPFTTDAVHPWIGFALMLLAAVHVALNRSWFAHLFRGGWSGLRVAQTALAFLGLVAMLAVPVSGALMSPTGLALFPQIEGMSAIRLVHLAGSYGTFALLSMHLGLNLSRLRPRAPSKRQPTPSRPLRILAAVLVAAIAAYGAYAFGKHGIIDYVTLRSHFVFWDYDTPIVLFATDYVAIMAFFAMFGHCLGKIARLPGTGSRLAVAASIFVLSALLVTSGRLTSGRGGQSAWLEGTSTWSDTGSGVEAAKVAAQDAAGELAEAPRALVAYFTWADNVVVEDPSAIDVDAVTSASVLPPGNVGLVARHVQNETGADLLPITVEDPYPADYDECLERAVRESDAQARPRLVETDIDVDDYDVLFLGYPNWWYSCPMAVLSFLEQNDLSGKTVIPFCVHGTGGLSNSLQALQETAPQARVLEPLSIDREDAPSSEAAVDAWVAELGYSK